MDLQAIFGTEKGESKFPNDPYWKSTSNGFPFFKRYQRYSVSQFKSAFSGNKTVALANLNKKVNKLEGLIAGGGGDGNAVTAAAAVAPEKKKAKTAAAAALPRYNAFRAIGGIDVSMFLQHQEDDEDADDGAGADGEDFAVEI